MSETYFSLQSGNFSQDWSDTSLISANDDWSGVLSIMGYLGDVATSLTGVDPTTLTADTPYSVDVIANQTSTAITNGGVAEFHIANPTIALQGSGMADAPNLVLFLDASNRQNVNVSFNLRDIDGTADNATMQVAVQYRIGSSGTWTNVPGGYVADATIGPSLATQVTPVSLVLPADANNQPQVQVRIITTNAVGNDEWVGVDDILVSSEPLAAVSPGALSIDDVTLVEGNAGTSDMTFTVNRTGGDDGAVSATWTIVLSGNANAADLATSVLTGTVNFADGQTSATITIPIAGDSVAEPNETFTVVLSAPTGGAVIGDGSGIGTIQNDDAAPLANVFINEFHYDNAGTDTNEFVELAGVAGTDLSGWKLVLYNGNGGAPYATYNLTGTLADQANGFGFLRIDTVGAQNGSPDGFALVDSSGRVVQFLSYEGTMVATSGPAAGLTSTDVGVEETSSAIGTTLQLVGTGSSYADFTWAAGVPDTAGAANQGQSFLSGTDQGQVRIKDASVIEGNAGESLLVFTVSRAGGFASEASVDWQAVLDGNADLADFAAGAVLSGTVTFAAGEYTKQIAITVSGDTLGEINETFTVLLGNAQGNVALIDAEATGRIVNDDVLDLTIMQIQGAGHRSEFEGQPVRTGGIVTAVDSNGFYLQDPGGDGNAATSDALFVFTGTAPTVLVGDAVTIGGTVSEFQAGAGLSLTQVRATSVQVLSSGNPLPAAVLIGSGGILPPTETIDDDGLTVFDPQNDGVDFWESLEGMRVTIDNPLVVSNTNEFGETDVVASLGVGATGLNDRGGMTISAGDFNPEKLQIDDRFGALIGYTPNHSIGDQLASVTGVIGYSFENYELLATEAVTVALDTTLGDDATSLRGDANFVTVATYNVENLDASDNKFDLLGADIVYNLGAPDIVALQEVQDADGAGNGSNLSGAATAQGLIDAIFAASGIVYTYLEIAPTVAGSTGGEPGGNIRNGYLYQADRVSLVEGSLALVTDPAFNGSRKPLVATWEFNGQQFTTINVHLTSRLGSDPLWGDVQPPVNGGEGARTAQIGALSAYVNNQLATDPDGEYMILGDWNGFYFEDEQRQLTDGGLFVNLATLLDEAERYSYVFEGNHQLIDNMLVTGGLFQNAGYDAVHINAQFGPEGRPTDHDPQVARLMLAITPHDLVMADAAIDENQPAGSVVGTLAATDTPGDVLHYSLLDDAGGLFAVDELTGVVTALQSLDHEAAASHQIVAKVTDAAGLSSTATITITVGDVNEAPVALADAVAVNEDATSGNLWSLLLGNDSDPDAGDVLSISAVDTSSTLGSVVFDAATQTLRYVADADLFDQLAPGATALDTFTYTVTDSGGLSRTATVTVTVTGIADTVTVTGGNGNDRLVAGNGEDFLFGGNGNDQLFGGLGHDWLQGDRGNDWLVGGDGRDSFVFGKSNGVDTVADFDKDDDRLVLLDGIFVTGNALVDANGDGQADLRIDLSSRGSVTLLGINSLSGVTIDSYAAATTFSAGEPLGWLHHEAMPLV